MADFGNSFRSARQAREMTLDAVAQETRISVRFLRAIEEEEFETLPGGLFRRGFIRTYASHIGLDPDEAVRTYEALTGDEPADVSGLRGLSVADPRDSYVAPLAVGGLVVMIVLFYVFNIRDAQTDPKRTVVSVRPTESAEVVTPPAPPQELVTVDSKPQPAPVEATVEENLPEASPAVIVQIEARELTWLLVQSDGREEEYLLDPGTRRLYTADASMALKIGNAAGVTLNWNGQEFDNLGGTGQVLNLSITSDGIAGLGHEEAHAGGPAA